MSRWFRFYPEAMRSPRVMRLSDKDFRGWMMLLSIAAERDGKIPAVDVLKQLMGMRSDHLSALLSRLLEGGLVDTLEDGYEPHNWKKYQYKSDTSTKRVRKYRAKCNVSETPPDTETDTEDNKPNGLSSVSTDKPTPANDETLKPEHVVEAWNAMADRVGLPQVRKLTPERRVKLNQRIKTNTIDEFADAIATIERSPFLRGDNNRGWRADFDFLLSPTKFTKLLEGSYDR